MKFNLKKIRESKGLTQKELAEIVGSSQNYISELESGRKFPSWNMMCKIVYSLNICPKELISCEYKNDLNEKP